MKIIHGLILSLALVIVMACEDEGGLTASGINGTWLLTETKCNGQTLAISGVSMQLLLNNGEATITTATNDCQATGNFDYTVDGNQLTSEPFAFTCNPNPCDQMWTVNGTPITLSCPDDFEGSSGETDLLIDGEVATATYQSNGSTCVNTYTKQ